MNKYFLHIIMFLLFFGCKQKEIVKDISINRDNEQVTSISKEQSETQKNVITTKSRSTVNWDSIYDATKQEAKEIRKTLIQNLNVNKAIEENRESSDDFISEFHKELGKKEFLRINPKNLDDNVLLPVYKFSNSLIGILLDRYQEDSLYSKYNIHTRQVYDRIIDQEDIRSIGERPQYRNEFLKHDSLAIEKMRKVKTESFYIYGSKGYTTSKIEDYVFYIDQCTHFEFYRIQPIDSLIGMPLFASKFYINLNYQVDTAVSDISQMELITSGCCAEDELDKVYATINDNPEYVLMYDDSQPNHGMVNYASRSIFYNSADTLLVPLLYMSVDFVRDECL